MFKRRLKEYTNELLMSQETEKNLYDIESEICKLKIENEKLKERLYKNHWIDKQTFDLENDLNKIIEILKNDSMYSIIINKRRLGNISIHENFLNQTIILCDSYTNKMYEFPLEELE